MSGTMLRQTCEEVVNKKMQDSEWVHLLSDQAAKLNAGTEYPPSYVDCIIQKWDRFKVFDLYDTHDFLAAHRLIQTGHVGIFQVPIGATPVADRFVEEMNGLLEGLTYPFHASFWGGTQGADGSFAYDIPVNCVVKQRQHDLCGYAIASPTVFDDGTPFGLPLEIGYQSSHKTWWELFQGIGLARWPYGHDRITVFTTDIHGANSSCFEELRKQVFWNFEAMPSPWDDWNSELAGIRGIQ